jgi:rare lipoprotein A
MLAPIPWLIAILLLAGCATGRAAAVGRVPPPAPPPRPSSPAEGKELKGMASWYGRPHHGKRTASGETYDMNKLTAAHRTLPLGTRLLVTNVENGRTVEVRINDRGPYLNDRMLDLSYAAAQRLGAVGDGVIPVTVKVLAGSSADDASER